MREYERDVEVNVPADVFGVCASLEAHRFTVSRALGRKDRRQMVEGNWLTKYALAVGSYVGEYAVCRVTGAYWSGLDGHVRDTTAGEVKWSVHPKYGLLLADIDVKDDEDYWLVVGEPPVVRVVGVLKGRDLYAAGWELTTNGRPPAVVVRQSNVLGWPR